MDDVGPLQLLTVAFDGNRYRGEILPELDRLKRLRIVRIIDLLVVRKDTEGRVMVSKASDLEWEEAASLGTYLGGLAGLKAAGPAGYERGALGGAAELADGHVFDEDDEFQLTQVVAPGMTVAIVLIEHLWAKPLLAAVARAGGGEVSNEWLRPEDVFAAGWEEEHRDEP